MPHEQFPHGPRTFENGPPVAAPRSLEIDTDISPADDDVAAKQSHASDKPDVNKPPTVEALKRKRRSVVISDRKIRSADVGVSGLYEVISEADLAFSPDSRAEAVTVFQGRIREEVVYGICMPVPGFSLLFVLVAVSAVVSALVAGSLLYRYQLQKEHLAEQAQRQPGSIPMSLFSNWMGLRLLKTRNVAHNVHVANSNGIIDATSSAAVLNASSSGVNGKTEDSRHCE